MAIRDAKAQAAFRNLEELLFQMEPHLRGLEGMWKIIEHLSETSDSVEPVVLEPLALLMERSFAGLSETWKEARAILADI